jgi:hypothetical protein
VSQDPTLATRPTRGRVVTRSASAILTSPPRLSGPSIIVIPSPQEIGSIEGDSDRSVVGSPDACIQLDRDAAPTNIVMRPAAENRIEVTDKRPPFPALSPYRDHPIAALVSVRAEDQPHVSLRSESAVSPAREGRNSMQQCVLRAAMAVTDERDVERAVRIIEIRKAACASARVRDRWKEPRQQEDPQTDCGYPVDSQS